MLGGMNDMRDELPPSDGIRLAALPLDRTNPRANPNCDSRSTLRVDDFDDPGLSPAQSSPFPLPPRQRSYRVLFLVAALVIIIAAWIVALRR
jgi:hypothetical protein